MNFIEELLFRLENVVKLGVENGHPNLFASAMAFRTLWFYIQVHPDFGQIFIISFPWNLCIDFLLFDNQVVQILSLSFDVDFSESLLLVVFDEAHKVVDFAFFQ